MLVSFCFSPAGSSEGGAELADHLARPGTAGAMLVAPDHRRDLMRHLYDDHERRCRECTEPGTHQVGAVGEWTAGAPDPPELDPPDRTGTRTHPFGTERP